MRNRQFFAATCLSSLPNRQGLGRVWSVPIRGAVGSCRCARNAALLAQLHILMRWKCSKFGMLSIGCRESCFGSSMLHFCEKKRPPSAGRPFEIECKWRWLKKIEPAGAFVFSLVVPAYSSLLSTSVTSISVTSASVLSSSSPD
jgi:hypothetical protein